MMYFSALKLRSPVAVATGSVAKMRLSWRTVKYITSVSRLNVIYSRHNIQSDVVSKPGTYESNEVARRQLQHHLLCTIPRHPKIRVFQNVHPVLDRVFTQEGPPSFSVLICSTEAIQESVFSNL